MAGPACPGFAPPQIVTAGPTSLPPTWTAARLGGEVTEEILVDRTGALKETRLVAAAVGPLAPFAQSSLERSRFSPGSIEGNPVAVRGVIAVPIGLVRKLKNEPPFDAVRVFVAGGEPREARWQLAGSVDRVTLVAHVGSAAAEGGASIVAVAPGGGEKVLLTIPAATPPVEVRETVRTGRFFHAAGDYALQLRAGGKPLATTTFTIATGFETAVVNACEPLPFPERTGPGH
ncbi:MAG TPA: hypothetical protein VFA98_09140 [Thermoanaerobaculia bacterium]|nr:hypothetical protein [Thermoanaerobaculia bacterium]